VTGPGELLEWPRDDPTRPDPPDGQPHAVDVYFLPGGVPEPGESYARAAAREVMEEVGMIIDPADLREVVRVEDDA
jgi:ADP-ribose pyrophosphatase YjhB (NUDIX family)